RQFVALGLPYRLAAGAVERDQKRTLLLIALHDDHVLIEDGRTGRAPFVILQVVCARVDAAEVAFPERLSLEIVRVDALRAEVSNHHAAVGRRRRVRVGGFHVALLFGRAFVGGLLPEQLAGVALKAEDAPTLHGDVVGRVALAVKPALEACIRLAADGRGDEDAVAPDDWARMREPRNRRAPGNAGALCRVPL